MQLHESAKNILIEQAQADVLREAFLYDVRRLEEARAKLGVLITEGYLSEEDLDAEILENYENLSISEKSDLNELVEALNSFDEIELLSEAPRKAAAPGGNKAAAANITKAIKGVAASKKTAAGAKPPVAGKAVAGKAAAPAAGAKPPVAGKAVAGKAVAGKAAAPAAGAKPPVAGKAVAGKAAAPAAGAKKPAARKAAPASKAVAQKAIQDIIAKMAKDDPAQFAKLQAAAQDPQKLQAVLASPAVQQNKTAVTGEIAQTPGADPAKPGLLGKLGAWAKKHPVKAGVGLAAIAALGTAAAIGTGGLAPLLGAALLGAGKGAAIGGTIGAVSGGAKQAIGDVAAGNKFSLKNIGKAAWSGLKKGAVVGAIGGAAGGVLGKIASNMSHGPGSHSASAGNRFPPDNPDAPDIHTRVHDEISAMKQRQADLMAKHPEGWNADHTKYSYHGNTSDASGVFNTPDQAYTPDGIDVKSLGNLGSHDAGAVNNAVDTIKQHLADGDITADQAKAYMAQLKKSLAGGGGGEGEF